MVKTFKELGLSESFLKILDSMGFKEPSEIQEKTIPLALAGKDVIGGSATGSGKTLAFGAPCIEKMKSGNGLQTLVLAPTRELAEQISKSLRIFSKNNPLRIVSIYGGVSIQPQIEDLREADIVVGTPGRILDHIARRTISLSKVNYLVLDEADRMLDMGFLEDVTRIIEHCPKNRQTLLFSATISADIEKIAKDYMKHPVTVAVESRVDPSKLEQVFYDVPSGEKFSLLVHLLKQEESKLVMVFANTKRSADFLGNNLRSLGMNALALHGDLSQNKRSRVLEQFNKSEKFILVCTDVAARGLDIKNVSHVYNYDSPKTSTEYIHRIGRTARAGKEGKAITILGDRDYENFRRVLSDDTLNIKKLELPTFEKVYFKTSSHEGRGRFGRGGRGNFSPGSRGRFGDRGGGRSRYGSRSGGRVMGSHSGRPGRHYSSSRSQSHSHRRESGEGKAGYLNQW